MAGLFRSKVRVIKLEPDVKKNKSEARVEETSDLKQIRRLDEGAILRKEWLEVKPDTRWTCLRCGWCCTQNWRVNLTWTEFDRVRNLLTIDEFVLDQRTQMSHPVYTIKGKCERYDEQKHECTIYKDRLYSCAAFPFFLTEDGKLLRSRFCKGFGKGEKVDIEKIKKHLKKWRKRAGMKTL